MKRTMTNDITLCHGDGGNGRKCALRHSCKRYIDLNMIRHDCIMRAQSQMLCIPSFMIERNRYKFYIPVGQNTDTVG